MIELINNYIYNKDNLIIFTSTPKPKLYNTNS